MDILKAVVLACLTALFGIFGYSVIHYELINIVRGIGIAIGVMLLVLVLWLLIKRIIKNLKEVEDLA